MPLKGIAKILSPDILHALSSMGHGDEIVLADAHFPSSSIAKSSSNKCIEIRADACSSIADLLEAILKLFPLDQYDHSNVILMDLLSWEKSAKLEVKAWKKYQEIVNQAEGKDVHLTYVERFLFYERARKAYAIIHTGDAAQYANVILKKGCIFD